MQTAGKAERGPDPKDPGWSIASYAGIEVCYRPRLDGGGTTFGQDYLPLFERLAIPRQQRIFEWCAGPGFIGFSLLAHGHCESLCLADVNPDAVRACTQTIARNGLDDRVSVHLSDCLDAIPATERWNIVVGNPPHFADMNLFPGPHEPFRLRAHDPGWSIHRRFYGKLGQFLAPGGIAILQENNQGSVPEDFAGMVADAGLRVAFNIGGQAQLSDGYYFLAVARANEPDPPWVNGIPYPRRIP